MKPEVYEHAPGAMDEITRTFRVEGVDTPLEACQAEDVPEMFKPYSDKYPNLIVGSTRAELVSGSDNVWDVTVTYYDKDSTGPPIKRDKDVPVLDIRTLPLPVTHQGFEFTAKRLKEVAKPVILVDHRERMRQMRASIDWVAKMFAEPGDKGHDPHEVAAKYPPGSKDLTGVDYPVVSSRGFERNGAGVVEVVMDMKDCYRLAWLLVRPHRPVEQMPQFDKEKGLLPLPMLTADYKPDLLLGLEESKAREIVAEKFDAYWFGGTSDAVQERQAT